MSATQDEGTADRGLVLLDDSLDSVQDESSESLASRVVSVIHSDIVSGRLRPGDRLVQDDIASRLSVSRTPIREAIRHLEALGLVVTEKNRGAFVRPLDPKHIRDSWVIRAELEALAARLATPLVSAASMKMLNEFQGDYRAAVFELVNSESPEHLAETFDNWNAANEGFHGTLLAVADNDQLLESVDRLQAGYPRRLGWLSVTSSRRSSMARVREHDVILRHLSSGNADAAGKAMRKHILDTGSEFVRWLTVPGLNP